MAIPKKAEHTLTSDRVTFIGRCNDGFYEIARTNGASTELRHLENVGDCSVTIACLGQTGGVFPRFNASLAPGEQLGRFVSPPKNPPAGGSGRPIFFVAFRGQSDERNGVADELACEIEMDRFPPDDAG